MASKLLIDSIIYTVRRLDEKYIEVASFENGSKEAISVYRVYKGKNNLYHCNCPGYWRQKVKEDHKHSRIVKLWCENLEEQIGFCFWMSGDDVEFHKFLDNEKFKKWLNQKDIKK